MAPTRENRFTTRIEWTGNAGRGTAAYDGYRRDWRVAAPGKAPIPCSNDPDLGGDPALMNPEDLLLSALAGCHMLWYLHLAAVAGIVVTGYRDEPEAAGETLPNGAGRLVSATLRPTVTVEAGADLAKAAELHGKVHRYCHVARSVAFPVAVEPAFVEE